MQRYSHGITLFRGIVQLQKKEKEIHTSQVPRFWEVNIIIVFYSINITMFI